MIFKHIHGAVCAASVVFLYLFIIQLNALFFILEHTWFD
jgi:hypothetical protein